MSVFLPLCFVPLNSAVYKRRRIFGNKSIEIYYLWIEQLAVYDFLVKIRFSSTDADCRPDNARECAARRCERVDGPLIARKFVEMHNKSLCECDKCRNFRHFNCSPPYSARARASNHEPGYRAFGLAATQERALCVAR